MSCYPNPAIVLVDDEPAMLGMLQGLVRDLAPGYDVVTVSDGGTALAEATQRPIPLLITDYRMPRMDGVALITALKAIAPPCPTVLLSCYLTPDVMQHGRAAGMDFYLAKPFRRDELVTLIQMVLEEAVDEAAYTAAEGFAPLRGLGTHPRGRLRHQEPYICHMKPFECTIFEHAVIASGPLVTDAAGVVCSSCSRAGQSWYTIEAATRPAAPAPHAPPHPLRVECSSDTPTTEGSLLVDTILEHRHGGATRRSADAAGMLVNAQVMDHLDALGEACYTVDAHWCITALNRTAEVLWGQIVGINTWGEFPYALGRPAERKLLDAMRERQLVAFEYYLPALERWFDVRAYPSDAGLAIALRDITTRKQVEIERERLLADLDVSRRMLQGIAEASPDLHYIFDLESGCAVYLSTRSEEIFGYTAAGLMDLGAQLVPTLVHPDDLPDVMEHLQTLQTLADREIYTFELRSLYPDGAYHWLQTSASVYVRGDDTRVRQIIGVTRDITTRKQAESEREQLLTELDQSRRLFQQIAETSPDALYVFDLPSGQTIYLSARSQQTMGYTVEEIRTHGVHFAALYWHPDDLRDLAQHRRALSELTDEAIYACEYRVRQADGTYRWLRTRSSVFTRADDGQVQQIIGVTQDITARKQAEANLLQHSSTAPPSSSDDQAG